MKFTLSKEEVSRWPRLSSQTERLPWLRSDFDHFKDDSDDDAPPKGTGDGADGDVGDIGDARGVGDVGNVRGVGDVGASWSRTSFGRAREDTAKNSPSKGRDYLSDRREARSRLNKRMKHLENRCPPHPLAAPFPLFLPTALLFLTPFRLSSFSRWFGFIERDSNDQNGHQ